MSSVDSLLNSGASAPILRAAPGLATNSLAELTASEFIELLTSRQVTVQQYLESCIEQIEALDPKFHAWHVFDAERVREQARKLDQELADGHKLARMTGVPVGVKDIFNTYDLPTGMGSTIMDGYTPGNDARVVSDIRLDKGIVMGKTETAEFAVHHPGKAVNPHDLARSPGTSSSGSAVSVATRMVPVALASQTGGSITRPASYCGILGFKPSFGLLPRTGVLKTTDTLDTIGFMSRSVADMRLMFEVCRVRGHNYPVSEAALNDGDRQTVAGRPWKVGVVRGPASQFENAASKAALDGYLGRLEAAGCDLSEVALSDLFDQAHDAHERIYRRCLAYYFDIEWSHDPSLFSASMQEMIRGGQEIELDQYQADMALQRTMAKAADQLFGGYDVLIGLSTADEAPMGLDGREQPDHSLIWTMCGLPTLSLPLLSGANGLPVGVQVVARRFDDYKLLDFANHALTA